MLEIILLLSLLSLLQADVLNVTYLETNQNISISESKFILCVQISDDIAKDDYFYLLFECDDEDKKMEKTLYYKFEEKSCKDKNTFEIDLNKPEEKLQQSEKEINIESKYNGFHYEYKFEKKEENQKYMLLLVKDFDGEEMKIRCNTFSVTAVIIWVIVIIVIIIAVVAIGIIIVCLFFNKRKEASMDQGAIAHDNLVNDETSKE